MLSAIPSIGMLWMPSSCPKLTGGMRRLSSTIPTAIFPAVVIPIIFGISKMRQLVQPVESRRLITFGKRRIIEHRIDKVFDGSAENHDSLADMEQFTGPFADNVHAQQEFRFAMKDQLQPPGRIASNLSPRNLAVI